MSYSTVSQEADNVYLNVVINHDDSQGVQPTLAAYRENKSSPIISKMEDYYMSIIRFVIPGDTIPLFIMPIVPGQTDPNLTPLVISIQFGTSVFPVNLEYFNTNPAFLPPNQNNPNGQIITPYYFTYSFNKMILMINTALATAYANFVAAFPAAPQVVANQTPFFFYDPATELISLIVHYTWATTGANQALITINYELANYLFAFPFTSKLLTPTLDTLAFYIDNNNGTNGYALYGTAPTNPPSFLQISQEYVATQYWISLRKLVILSSSLPTRKEVVPVINEDGSQTGQYAGQSILTDFVPPVEYLSQVRTISYYNPTSQYRLVDIPNSGPLSNIDISVYWQDKLGNLYPIYLSVYQQASFKIGFFRKTLYKHPSLKM